MIGTLPTEAKINWQEQLPNLVHAYNYSHSNVTGFCPFYLLYGRQPMLPIDVQFGVWAQDIVASTLHSYIQKLQRRLEWAYKIANKVSKKESECSKNDIIKISDAPGWNQEILSLSDKKQSKGNLKSVIDRKIPLIM